MKYKCKLKLNKSNCTYWPEFRATCPSECPNAVVPQNLPKAERSEAHDSLLAEVSSVDEARDYLLSLCRYKFKDKTFESYILNRLAGDFAVEIANVFIRKRNARNFS